VLTSAWEAQSLRENGVHARYTSLQLDPAQRREVILVHTKRQSFFRYKNETPGMSVGSEQTLTHLFAKELIAGMQGVTFFLPQGPLHLQVAHWEIEKSIDVGQHSYFADLAGSGLLSSRPELTKSWQHLIVEITVTHASSDFRIEQLRQEGWAVIEVKIARSLHIPQGINATEKQILAAKEKMTRAFRRGIYARILADPGTPPSRWRKLQLSLRHIWKSFAQYP